MTQSQQRSSADGPTYELVSPDKLFFDAKNPRLAEYGIGARPTQTELLEIMWQKMAVDELVMSIAARGYFRHEPLFVTEEGNRLVVLEGNRRLAAVKLLLDPEARARLRITDLPVLSPEVRENITHLPIIRTTARGDLAVHRLQAC